MARKRAAEAVMARDSVPAYDVQLAAASFEPSAVAAGPVFLVAMPEVPWKSGRSYPTRSDALHPRRAADAAPGAPGAADSADPGVWSLGWSSGPEAPPLPFDPHAMPEPHAQPAPDPEPYRAADGRPYFTDETVDGMAFLPGAGHTYVFEQPTLLSRDPKSRVKWHHPKEEESEFKSLVEKLRFQFLQFDINNVPVKCDASLNGKKVVFKLKMKM